MIITGNKVGKSQIKVEINKEQNSEDAIVNVNVK